MRLSPGQGNPEMNLYLRRRVHSIVVTMDPRTTLGDSLLHLAVARNNTLKSQVGRQHTHNLKSLISFLHDMDMKLHLPLADG